MHMSVLEKNFERAFFYLATNGLWIDSLLSSYELGNVQPAYDKQQDVLSAGIRATRRNKYGFC
jgi:hypothetical protein